MLLLFATILLIGHMKFGILTTILLTLVAIVFRLVDWLLLGRN